MRWQIPLVMLLQGCSLIPKNHSSTSAIDTIAGMATPPVDDACGSLAILSWIGGLSIIGGIIALVITRSFGARAIVIGILLVLLNYAVQKYAHAIFIPALIGTGIISLVYAFIVVRNALKSKSLERSSTPWAPTPSRRSH